jgi:hypothetical protein
MVVNFKARGISRGACKLAWTPTFVATQFLTHVLVNFQKNPKIAKNIENPKQYVF